MTYNKLTRPVFALLALFACATVAFAERYLYDAAGRLSAVRYDNGLQTTYVYDANDNLLLADTAAAPALPASERFTTGGGGAASYATPGISAEASPGYGLLTTESGAAPYGATLIRFRQGGILVSEAGLPAVAPTTRARIFVDRPQSAPFADTGIVLVNPSTSSAQITLVLRDPEGNELTRGSARLAAGAHVSHLLSGLHALAPAFAPSAGITTWAIASLEVESDSPIAVSALRVSTNQRGDLLYSAALTADLALAPPGGPMYIPHLANGGGFTTALHLMNPTLLPLSGIIEFFADDGQPLPLSTVNAEPAPSSPYSIAPGGVFSIETGGSSQFASGGWARITPADGGAAPFAAGVLRLIRDGIAVSESNIATAPPTTLARAYADQSGGRDTALVLANPGPETTVELRAYALDGVSLAARPGVVRMPANGHRSFQMGSAFPDLPPEFRGVIEISATTPVSATTFRLLNNERGDPVFASLPAADMTRAAPSPLVFPHIVDGGGFQSEIILLSPKDAVNVLRFFGPDGLPFDTPL